jgi:hypothetical protein
MSEKKLMVIPAAGLFVRDPRPGKPKFLPVDGDVVPNDPYWRRRINDGDVVEVTNGDNV